MVISEPSGVLVLSGLPGSGKTHYARWLEDRGWCRVETDKLLSEGIDLAWLQLIAQPGISQDGLSAFVGAAERLGKPLVVEWGFPPQYLPRVQELLRAGLNCWWFDGDRHAALRSWKTLPGRSEGDWHRQVAAISELWPAIVNTYGPGRIIRTIESGPVHVTPERIHRLLGLDGQQV